MSTLLKDIYSPFFYNKFSDSLTHVIDSFDKQKFIADIFDKDFNDKELKERMRHTSRVLHQYFPTDYSQVVELIKKIIQQLRQDQFKDNVLEFMFFPDYIELYGIDDYENSVLALEFVTQFVSCEFAVRPFILKYRDRMMQQMLTWSLHENYRVRRLASEGCRPRLPWAMALPELKKDPGPVLLVLENMKNDTSEWVRRSVANNLNDIAKDNPERVIEIASAWKGISKETDAIIKHGCRTLLKQGHIEILKHYGLKSNMVEVSGFKILTDQVRIGESLEFIFEVSNNDLEAQTIRLEYAIYYKRLNKLASKKVFKISERVFRANESICFQRKHSFKLITTRKFYAGLHQLSLIMNGQEKQILDFELIG